MRAFGASTITPVVQKLILINVVIWFVFVLIGKSLSPFIFKWFGFSPSVVLSYSAIWQFITYSFLHSPDVLHILFNMFCLWMFGVQLEGFWGSRKFLTYYLFCALGASVLYFLYVLGYYLLTNNTDSFFRPLIGASGAIFGLIIAFGFIFRNQTVYFMMIFPMRAWHFALLLTGIELVMLIESGNRSQVAYAAHLGGILSAFFYFYILPRLRGLFSLKCFKKSKKSFKIVVDNEKPKKTHFH